jgi:nucleoside-diphosphate-sugar epimerase
VSFALPLAEAREVNLEGTRRMLELAELARAHGGLECYAHISTAFVAGDHPGSFAECDADVGQAFHNSYEQSKFEAEQLIRSRDVPFTILRPSIVVGDRNNGWTSAFNVLYWPLRAFARGLFTAVPAIPSAAVDVVSVDYVADAAYQLCETSCGNGATCHLTAGKDASTIAELAGLASRYFRRPVPRVVPPAEFATMTLGAAERKALEAGSEYFPYFSMEGTFDDREARKRLEPDGITTAPLRDYVDRLLDFATRARWGKRPIARVEAFADPAYPIPLRAAS